MKTEKMKNIVGYVSIVVLVWSVIRIGDLVWSVIR